MHIMHKPQVRPAFPEQRGPAGNPVEAIVLPRIHVVQTAARKLWGSAAAVIATDQERRVTDGQFNTPASVGQTAVAGVPRLAWQAQAAEPLTDQQRYVQNLTAPAGPADPETLAPPHADRYERPESEPHSAHPGAATAVLTAAGV